MSRTWTPRIGAPCRLPAPRGRSASRRASGTAIAAPGWRMRGGTNGGWRLTSRTSRPRSSSDAWPRSVSVTRETVDEGGLIASHGKVVRALEVLHTEVIIGECDPAREDLADDE